MLNHQNSFLKSLNEKGLPIFEETMNVGVSINCTPCYRNNEGFHHVKSDKFEAIILKGVYKGFLRLISGSSDFDDNTWLGIATILNNAEQNMDATLQLTLNVADFITIAEAEPFESVANIHNDRRDYFIPRPLTQVEYMLPTSNLYDSNVILSSSFFANVLPNTLTPFSLSIYEKLPELLNPIFISCNLKTYGPTILPAFNKLFINVASFESNLEAIGVGNSTFRLNFATQLYLKTKSKSDNLKKGVFPIEDIEIRELLDDFEQSLFSINHSNIVENTFFEKYAQIAIIDEYIFIKLSDVFNKLSKIIPDKSDVLRAFYLTRESNIFANDIEASSYFDVNFKTEVIKFELKYDKLTVKDIIKKLSFIKRLSSSGKVKSLIKKAHSLLDMRDRSFILKQKFNKQVRKELLKLSEYAVNKGRIKSSEDIFIFSHEEVRRIAFDSYYGEVNNTIKFKKWQLNRFSALVIPQELYAYDIERVAEISEKIIIKAIENNEFKTISFFHDADFNGTVGEDILVKDNLPVTEFNTALKYKALVLENFSMFSHLAEFACLNNLSVHTGVRFAKLIFGNEELSLKKSTILRSRND